MLTYETQECPRCRGNGTVRFLLIFHRECPECDGTGQIHVPQITHEQNKNTFEVMELSPQTLKAVKTNPDVLKCLSPSNRADLLQKYSELRSQRLTPHLKGFTQSPTERRRRINSQAMAAQLQRQQFSAFVQKNIEHQHHMFTNQVQSANQQFQNFINQNRPR